MRPRPSTRRSSAGPTATTRSATAWSTRPRSWTAGPPLRCTRRTSSRRTGTTTSPSRRPMRPPPAWTAWAAYFGHADVDAAHARIAALGGRALSDPMDVGAGRIAVLADPQGAVFAVWTGDYN